MLILDVGYNLIFTSSRCRIQDTVNGIIDNVTVTRDVRYNVTLRPEGGGAVVKIIFSVLTYLIRAAGGEQEEKNRTEI